MKHPSLKIYALQVKASTALTYSLMYEVRTVSLNFSGFLFFSLCFLFSSLFVSCLRWLLHGRKPRERDSLVIAKKGGILKQIPALSHGMAGKVWNDLHCFWGAQNSFGSHEDHQGNSIVFFLFGFVFISTDRKRR